MEWSDRQKIRQRGKERKRERERKKERKGKSYNSNDHHKDVTCTTRHEISSHFFSSFAQESRDGDTGGERIFLRERERERESIEREKERAILF